MFAAVLSNRDRFHAVRKSCIGIPVRYFMRLIALLFLLCAAAAAEDPTSRSDRQNRAFPSADVLYRPVIYQMWSQDEGEHPYAQASGFIRMAVHPAWSPEFFVDVVLNRNGPPTITLYSLPKGVKNLRVLLKNELKQHPGADASSLAKMLPVHRKKLQADKKTEDLITDFFSVQWQPRRIPADTVRLDATEYELIYVGDDTLVFDSDDHETPMVKWMESLLSALQDHS